MAILDKLSNDEAIGVREEVTASTQSTFGQAGTQALG